MAGLTGRDVDDFLRRMSPMGRSGRGGQAKVVSLLHCPRGRLRALRRPIEFSPRALATRQSDAPPKAARCIAEGNADVQAWCGSVSKGNARVMDFAVDLVAAFIGSIGHR